jgi:hypothetical protein
MDSPYITNIQDLSVAVILINNATKEWIITDNQYLDYLDGVRSDLIKNTTVALLKEKTKCLKEIVRSNERIQDFIQKESLSESDKREIDMEKEKKLMMTQKIEKLEYAIYTIKSYSKNSESLSKLDDLMGSI